MAKKKTRIADLRGEYASAGLHETKVPADPFVQFRRWFKDAAANTPRLPNAMTLATAAKSGEPSVRMVLLKEYDRRGFVFYTNYGSKKAHDLGKNARAALLLHWDSLERQIRISGRAHKVPRAQSAAYFHSRPRESQLAAWASRQSTPLASREVLEKRFNALRARYRGKRIPLPPYWGGYRVVPQAFEFWQGRKNRLHDRLHYARRRGGTWTRTRLSP